MTTSFPAGKIPSLADLANVVKIRRKALGLTQADLANLVRTGNRFIVDLEKGKPTLQIGKVLAVVSLLGLELYIKEKCDMLHRDPTQTTGRPRSLKEAMLLGKEHGDTDSFIREFLDEFYVEQNNLTREIMLREEPPLVTEDRINAYLAAVAEHLAFRNHLPVPKWVTQPRRFLKRPFFPGGLESLKATMLIESPSAFRRRMIFVGSDPLYRPRRDAVGFGH